MIDFDNWWNSAAADDFRAKHEDLSGEAFRPVWDACMRATSTTAQPAPAAEYTDDELCNLAEKNGLGVSMTPIGLDTGRVFATHRGYRTEALLDFAHALLDTRPSAPLSELTMSDAIAAGDGTLHGAVDYWQARALAAEAKVPSEAEQDAHATNQVLANNYLHMTCAPPAAPLSEPTAEGVTETMFLVCAGGDDYQSEVVPQSRLDDAYLLTQWGSLAGITAEEKAEVLSNFHDPDQWLHMDPLRGGSGRVPVEFSVDFEDGWVRVVRLPALSSPASSAGRPSDDELWDQTLAERDRYHERADELAGAIAEHLGIDIGEHSNLNDPWQNALAAIASSAGMDAHGEPVDAVKELKLAAAHASTFPRDTMVVPLDEAVSFVAQSGEPVAWCALTPSGQIAYFDGKPMVMPGPVGNEHHTVPMYARPTAPAEPVAWAVDESAIERMTAAGREAWKGVPDASAWVDEMRGEPADPVTEACRLPRHVRERIDAAAAVMSEVLAWHDLESREHVFARALSGLRALQANDTTKGK